MYRTTITTIKTKQGASIGVSFGTMGGSYALTPLLIRALYALIDTNQEAAAMRMVKEIFDNCHLIHAKDTVDFLIDARENKVRHYTVVPPMECTDLPGPIQVVRDLNTPSQEAQP